MLPPALFKLSGRATGLPLFKVKSPLTVMAPFTGELTKCLAGFPPAIRGPIWKWPKVCPIKFWGVPPPPPPQFSMMKVELGSQSMVGTVRLPLRVR